MREFNPKITLSFSANYILVKKMIIEETASFKIQ